MIVRDNVRTIDENSIQKNNYFDSMTLDVHNNIFEENNLLKRV